MVVIELTVPWETRCQEAYEREIVKYKDLLMECREAGWQTWSIPVEVGALWLSSSIMLENDGITGYEWTNTEESSQRHDSGSREGIKLVVATKRRW